MTYRVVGWSTGGVGRLAIRAIARRPDLELAGVWVHSAEKDGVDAGTLAGIDPLGVAATTDADALLAAASPTASATRPRARSWTPPRSPTWCACSRPGSTW